MTYKKSIYPFYYIFTIIIKVLFYICRIYSILQTKGVVYLRTKNKLKEIKMRDYIRKPEEFAKLINTNIKSYYSYDINFSKPTLEKTLKIASKLNKTLYKIWYLK